MTCSIEDCTRKPAFIVGHCSYCDMNYCLAHRLPEQHNCNQMKKVREIAIHKLKTKFIEQGLKVDNNLFRQSNL